MSELIKYLPEVAEVIKGAMNSIDVQDLSIQQPLYELGIDSLVTINLLVEMGSLADIDLEDFIDDIDPPKTIGDLCQITALLKGMK